MTTPTPPHQAAIQVMKPNPIGRKVKFQWTRRNVIGIVEGYDGSENVGRVIVRPLTSTCVKTGKDVPLGTVPRQVSLITKTLNYCE